MPTTTQDTNRRAAIALCRFGHQLIAMGLAMQGGVNPDPKDLKSTISVLSTIGRANEKGLCGDPGDEEPELNDGETVEAEPETATSTETKSHFEKTAQELKAPWLDPSSKSGRFNPRGKAKMAYLVGLGWKDRAVAKNMGIRDNAVAQFRNTRGIPKGTVDPTPEEIEHHISC